jgi:hypothetical protein
VEPAAAVYDENDNDGEDDDEDLTDDVLPAVGLQGMDVDDDEDTMASASASRPSQSSSRGRRHGFFVRSESTLCLGCPPPADPFSTPLREALPLAELPHLLQPNARREDLFGAPKQPLANANAPANVPPLSILPTRLGLAMRNTDLTLEIPQATSSAISGQGSAVGAAFEGILQCFLLLIWGKLHHLVVAVGLRSQPPLYPSSGAVSPANATCDTASVRSLDTSVASASLMEQPQDLSSRASSVVSELATFDADSQPPTPGTSYAASGPMANVARVPPPFTSPKKAFMLREAANRESEQAR